MFWCEGVVLKTRPMGEADRVVILYTKELGKVGTAAKGSRRPKNRLAAVVQPFTRGRFFLSKPSKGLKDLSQGSIIESNQNIRDDLLKMAACNYFLELIDLSVETEDPDEDIYRLLILGIKLIGLASDLELSLRYLEYRLLYTLGWALQLEYCANCGKEIDKDNIEKNTLQFSPIEGGITCSNCKRGDEVSISMKTRAILQGFDRLKPRALFNLKLDKGDKVELEKILRLAWDVRIEKSPKTWQFWKEVSSLEN